MRSATRVLLGFLVVIAVGCGGGDDGAPAARKSTPAAPDPAELAGRWWQWATGGEGADDPVTDPSGAACARRQGDDVFFLAGTPGGEAQRSCSAPAGVPLFLPVLNSVCPTEGAPPDQVAAECGEGLETGAEVSLTVDGRDRPVEYLESPAFDFDPRPGSFAGDGARGEAVAVGHHALLEPLPPGEHTIEFAGRAGDFAVAVRYRLTVAG